MNQQLQPVWHMIEQYLDNGLSLIPVRDKDEADKKAKSPYGSSWKKYQTEIIHKGDLFEQMERYNTTAVGIVAGEISQNLEVIDIDVKYKPGIDALLFKSLNELYPQLFKKLRIHKTPTGGYHILYRCTEKVPGSQKLAGRPKSEEELQKNPKGNFVNFIETKAEGGYVCAPPSLGYSVHVDNPIPIITKAERDAIITLCSSFTEIYKPEPKAFTQRTQGNSIYDTNPFEDFNQRCDAAAVAREQGWPEVKESSRFIWFTRPGKDSGISMSFNKHSRFFFNFTASTALEENKGYTPSNFLLHFRFNGDKKELYRYLVASGFGKMRPDFEQRLVKKAAQGQLRQIPANISSKAKEELQKAAASEAEIHPYGVFWMETEKNGIVIDREALYTVASGLGFKLFRDDVVREQQGFLFRNSTRQFFDVIKAYIKEEDAYLYKDICNAYEAFIERHGKFTISRLPLLDENEILKDTETHSYKVYNNGVLEISKDGYERKDPSTYNKLIWDDARKKRDFRISNGGKYVEFINLALNYTPENKHVLNTIGYLAHEYKDETAGYIIVLTEECEDPSDGGGSGKNLFASLFSNITTYTSKPGDQTNMDEKFFQSWNGERIFCISDVPERFKYSFLKDISTSSGILKKLFKDQSNIPLEEMPKFIINTNFSFETKDGGLKRRIRALEFTDFFTKCGGVDTHFNTHFTKGWNDEDWAGFDTIMAKAVQSFLSSKRKISITNLSSGGWLKQFRQSYGQTITDIISNHIDGWVKQGYVTNDDFKQQIDTYYIETGTPLHYRPSFTKLNSALENWCKHYNLQYVNQISMWDPILQKTTKRKWFGNAEDTPF